ncbi:Nudix hydrolase domain-containing protein [Fusarium keratoplasticum]|uniref:Nudix hydrolase domain-containing protein n=1 Tax=Fusarium keratoplasticum TaxID=1328300 RepID=A0ACC0RAV6_9HYPO|nr:Nudix hydrolase domain-containing protein [Fusarium keratoplasticum]KAI8680274.1 Nudix hydrolase domain-containing protein [Fusarium keratoplasticum]
MTSRAIVSRTSRLCISSPRTRTISTSMAPLKHRAVASSFIFKFPEDDMTKKPQVALFRRSGQVSTYQHKYAGVSGSVEETDENPLATAWREIQEETTLTSDSLRLFRQGKPFSFADESIGRKWTINPFGFVLKSEKEGGRGEAGIQIDWEHEGYEWFDPAVINESEGFQGVPRILESLRRVWFNIDLGEAAGKTLAEGLTALQTDHESGARQLASKALDIFIKVIRQLDTGARDQWWKNVRFAGWHLWKNGRESMGASILNVVLASLKLIEQQLPSQGTVSTDLVDGMIAELEKYTQERQDAGSKVSASLEAFLEQTISGDEPLRILTLSSSSTITSGITRVLSKTSRPVEVRVLESRPLFEGVKMASAISSFVEENKVNARLVIYTDASVGVAAKDVDVVLIGADLIDKTANVSNKTGSLPAVLTAKHVSPKSKIVVLSEKEKVLPFNPPGQEENDPCEVTQAWDGLTPSTTKGPNTHIDVKNIYFEWIPSSLIDHYVTEDGIATSEGISGWAGEVHKRADQFFTDL